MTLEEKVGQMTLIERSELANPANVATWNLGGVLSGGGSAPVDNTPAGWADMVDAFQAAALSTRLGIPILYGTDSVHGDGNLLNSTIFPHNIGIGATRDTELARQIGRATPRRPPRPVPTGRSRPALRGTRHPLGPHLRELQRGSGNGQRVRPRDRVPGRDARAGPASILATAKRYLGDGATTNGVNEGDAPLGDDQLRATQLPPYKAAVSDGVGSVMVSFSSVNGILMHANAHLITDTLKTELGFDGFVVSDWAGINRIDGVPADASRQDVSTAVNAGVDMNMVPFGAEAFEATLTQAITGGDIPMGRVDDAVRQILGVKVQLGLFEHPQTDRSLAATVGSAGHRALARRAVAETLVVLRNAGGLLPLKRSGRILVAGKNADDIGSQSGGWTVTFQGSTGPTTTGTSILAGIREAVGSAGTVAYDESGATAAGNDVGIAVLGEEPYAESQGDRFSAASRVPRRRATRPAGSARTTSSPRAARRSAHHSDEARV